MILNLRALWFKNAGTPRLEQLLSSKVFVLIENHQKGTGLAKLYSKHVKEWLSWLKACWHGGRGPQLGIWTKTKSTEKRK